MGTERAIEEIRMDIAVAQAKLDRSHLEQLALNEPENGDLPSEVLTSVLNSYNALIRHREHLEERLQWLVLQAAVERGDCEAVIEYFVLNEMSKRTEVPDSIMLAARALEAYSEKMVDTLVGLGLEKPEN